MKNDIELKVKLRDLKKDNINRKRKDGKIPAVVYGDKKDNKNLWVDALVFAKLYERAGENTIVKLATENGGKENVLIYDYQLDPLTDEVMHIDFLRVDMKRKIEAEVPLVFIGEAPAVKELGGTLIKSLNNIAVKCLPGNIPSEFKVDLSKINDFDSYFTVADLETSDEVEILVADDVIIVSATPPRSEEELAELDEKVEEDVSQVDGVEKEGEEKEIENTTEKSKETEKTEENKK